MNKHTSKNDALVGIWRSAAEFGSDVAYRVSKKKTGYSVVVQDTGDGERADVFEEKWDAAKGIFSFATHWNSTGRFLRCRLQAASKKQVELTYTYTDTDVLVRADAKADGDMS